MFAQLCILIGCVDKHYIVNTYTWIIVLFVKRKCVCCLFFFVFKRFVFFLVFRFDNKRLEKRQGTSESVLSTKLFRERRAKTKKSKTTVTFNAGRTDRQARQIIGLKTFPVSSNSDGTRFRRRYLIKTLSGAGGAYRAT